MGLDAIEHRILQLLGDAETPLYSAWRWLDKQTGGALPLERFLVMVDELASRDQVRLWHIDFESRDRAELFEVPVGLPQRYEEHDDDAYDPFGYSLTLGPNADIDRVAEWELDLNFQQGTFELLARNPNLQLDDILNKLSSYFPDVSLIPTETLRQQEERRIIGRVSQ